jgi:fructan beta-fructosidase
MANGLSLFNCILLLAFSIAFGQTPGDRVLKKEIEIKKGQHYLNLPVKNSERLVRTTIRLNEKPLDQFTINLASSDPDFWTFFDVTPYQGKTLVIEVANAPARQFNMGSGNATQPELKQDVLNLIHADTKFPGQDSLYMEEDRPQAHFTANRGWINDPNGLIYYDGEYHMFFQHNPYGWQWGNMHWGHAVSKDLVHWTQLKEALYPFIDETEGARSDAAFSGSAVSDPQNTSGFRRDGIDPLIVIYTSTGRGECLKLSYDRGLTFDEYPGNPILKHNGRDPKVFWYEPGKHWIMVVWESGVPHKLSNGTEISLREHSIYTSPDLKAWTYQSGVSGFFECPELFELPVEGEPGVKKWIMSDANGRYVVGTFDGKRFAIEQHFTRYENGGGYFYASQTFYNSPDGRRIQVGWGRNITHPGMPFNQPQLFPSELRLKRTSSGYRLCPTPVTEINKLHGNSRSLNDKTVQSGEKASLPVDENKAVHVIAEIERGDAPITLNLLGYELRYDNEWTFATTAPDDDQKKQAVPQGAFPAPTASTPVTYVTDSRIFKIEAIVDKNLLEFFINDGELYYVTAFNGKKSPVVELSIPGAQGGGSRAASPRKYLLKKLEVHELNSIWQK